MSSELRTKFLNYMTIQRFSTGQRICTYVVLKDWPNITASRRTH